MTALIKSATVRLAAPMESSWSVAKIFFPSSIKPIPHSALNFEAILRAHTILFMKLRVYEKMELMSVGLETFVNVVYWSEYEITLIKSIFTHFPVIYG